MKIKLAVGGALFKNNKLLLIKRSRHDSWLPSYWEIPGGKRESDESLEQAIKREFIEEVGMKIKPDKTYYGWSEKRKNEIFIEIDFIVKSTSTAITLDKKEAEEYQWLARNETKKLKMTKEMRKTVNVAFENMGQ